MKMNNQELAALCRIEIRRWQSVPDKQYMVDLLELALASLTAEPVADEEKMLAEQAKAVIHCLDMCEVPEGDYADNPQLKLWGRVIEYGRLPAPVVPDEFFAAEQNEKGMFELSEDCMCRLAEVLKLNAIDNTAQQYEALAGWKMVPIEPSKEMLSQIHPIADGNCSHCGNRTTLDCEENMLLSWRDMLEAAPKPEGKDD